MSSEQTDKCVKILHVIDKLSNDGSGIHGPARQLSYRLPLYPAERFSTRVISLRSDETALQEFAKRGVSARCLYRSKFDPRSYVDIVRGIRDFQPHILHLHGYASQALGRVAGLLKRIPTVIQEHAILPNVPPYQRLADFLLGGAQTTALAVSDGVADFLRRKRYVRGDIHVIWNGVPDEEFDAPMHEGAHEALRRELGLRPDQPVTGMVSRLAAGKGHATFLEAALRIREKAPGAQFFIVGEGPCRSDIEQCVRKLGLDSAVHLTGFRSDALRIMAMLDVHVIASFQEGFPGVAVENLVTRTPMVCSDISAFRNFLENGRDCLMFPPGDADALADAVLSVLIRPDEASARAEMGFRTAEQCRISRIAREYMDLYERIANQA